MIIDKRFQADFLCIYNALAPLTKRAYFVGGAARDSLIGRTYNDIDIEVFDIEPKIFDQIMQSIGAKGVGKSFFVYRLGAFDISLPRSESKNGIGHRAFAVEWCNEPRIAARRRDFTINAMMINIFSGELLDFFGGANDIKLRVIRHIDADSFMEDSLRVLRAMRFAAELGFRVANETVELCRSAALNDITNERVWIEFEKMFRATDRIKGIYYLFSLLIAHKLLGLHTARLRLFRYTRLLPLGVMTLYAFRAIYRIKTALFRAPLKVQKLIDKMPLLPHRVTDHFLIALALKMPLNQWG